MFLHNRDFRNVLSRFTSRKLFLMDREVHRLSKLCNRRKRTNDTRNCLNDHLFVNHRDFNHVLRNFTCSKLFLMNLVKHGRSKHFTTKKVNQRQQQEQK